MKAICEAGAFDARLPDGFESPEGFLPTRPLDPERTLFLTPSGARLVEEPPAAPTGAEDELHRLLARHTGSPNAEGIGLLLAVDRRSRAGDLVPLLEDLVASGVSRVSLVYRNPTPAFARLMPLDPDLYKALLKLDDASLAAEKTRVFQESARSCPTLAVALRDAQKAPPHKACEALATGLEEASSAVVCRGDWKTLVTLAQTLYSPFLPRAVLTLTLDPTGPRSEVDLDTPWSEIADTLARSRPPTLWLELKSAPPTPIAARPSP
jgi:hypothetical protein